MIRTFLFSFISSFFIFSSLSGDDGNIEIGPMIKFSYDLNLGTTIGLGLAIIKFEGGVGQGPYFIYSYSKFNNKKKKGTNLSLGMLAGVGLASFKVGFNRMAINSESDKKIYWGIYTSPTFLIVHTQGGIMFEDAQWEKRKLNLSAGLGIF